MIDKRLIKKTFVKQHDSSDCGVACLLSILKLYGESCSLEHLRNLSGTTTEGTTLLGLYQAAKELNFDAEGYEMDIETLKQYNTPLILHFSLEQQDHYVNYFGYNKSVFIIGDPSKGIIEIAEEELKSMWKTNTCLSVSHEKGYVNKKNRFERSKFLIKLLREDFSIIITSIIIGLFIAILGISIAVFTQKLIDEIIPEEDKTRLILSLVIVFVLLIIRILFSFIRQVFLYSQSKEFNLRIIAQFYNYILHLPKSFFDTRKTGDVVARLNDTRRIQGVISSIIGDTIIEILLALVTLVFLFYYSHQIGLLVAISLPFFIFIVQSFNKSIIKAHQNSMIGYALSESYFINTIQGIDTIKSLNKQALFKENNNSIYKNYQNSVYEVGIINAKLSSIAGFLSVFLIISSIAAGSFLVFNNQLKIGELMAVITLTATIAPAIVNLSLVSLPWNEAKVALDRMIELTSMKLENNKGVEIKDKIESIRIDNISFRFPGRNLLLNRLSLSAKLGEMIFIIGESGCGKSTLCKIIEKSYFPETGKILINNNVNLFDVSINNWRDKIGILPQEPFIFNGTVFDNIVLGSQPKSIDEITHTLKQYGFDSYINNLPQGYDTIIGEEGINLSGGQKQLIALMRLILKNPELLILDEPTSAMDRELEIFTLNLLNTIKHEKIIIFISHRLHLLKKYANRILLLENGIIRHHGSHEQLLKTNNLYSEYYMAYQDNSENKNI